MADNLIESRRKIVINSPHIASSSGSIVTVNDAIKAKLKSCVVDVNPVQEGTGDPSPDNIRPISGWTECNVYDGGKNKFNINHLSVWYNNVISISDIDIANNSFRLSATRAWRAAGTQQDTFSLEASKNYLGYCEMNVVSSDSSVIRFGPRENNPGGTMVSGAGVMYREPYEFNTWKKHGADFTGKSGNNVALCFLITDRDVSHSTNVRFRNVFFGEGKKANIPFPSEAGTVYGGMLDATNGLLTVTNIGYDMGDMSWKTDSSANLFYAAFTKLKIVPDGVLKGFYCSSYRPNVSMSLASIRSNKRHGNLDQQHNTNNIYICDTRYTYAADFKAANIGQTLVIPLATPVTYQLTPTQIDTMTGLNNIWADTGDISVKYWAHS